MRYFFLIIMSITIIGCDRVNSDYVERHDLVNIVLEVIDADRNAIKYKGGDTIVFRDYVIEPVPNGFFGLEINNSDTIFHFNGWSSTVTKFERYFTTTDIPDLLNEINIDTIATWDTNFLRAVNIADTTYFNKELTKAPDYKLWYRIHNNDIDYVVITEPILYRDNTRAIVGLSIYLKDFYIQEIFSLNRKEDESWAISTRYIVINKMIVDENFSEDTACFNMNFIEEIDVTPEYN